MAYTTTSNMGLRKTVETGCWYDEINQIKSNETANASVIDAGFCSVTNCATNASCPNLHGRSIGKLWTGAGHSRMSISTIAGCISGKPFTLIRMSSNASYWIKDDANFRIGGNWLAGWGDTISLVWDGSKYYEIIRSNN